MIEILVKSAYRYFDEKSLKKFEIFSLKMNNSNENYT